MIIGWSLSLWCCTCSQLDGNASYLHSKVVTHNMLQVRLLSNIVPGHTAGVDESSVSVVNLSASEPPVGVVAQELVAFDPFGGIELGIQTVLHRNGFEDVGSAILSLNGLK